MWELDYKESWVPKNWCFWTVVLEKTLASPLDCKEIQPVHPKGNWSWIFIGRTDAEAETPILWPPHVKSWLIGKDPDTGRDWGRRKRGWQRMRWLDGITNSMHMSWVDSRSWWWTGRPGVLQFMGSQRVGHNWATELTKVCHSVSPKKQVSFNFVAAVAICSDFGAQENKICHCFHCFTIYVPWSDGTGCHDLSFLNVEF